MKISEPLTPAQLRRRAAAKAAKRDRRRRSKIKGVAPVRDSNYLAWLRRQWCVLSGSPQSMSFLNPHNLPVCEEMWNTEAAHVGAIRGLGQKCDDREAIPLCAGHHRLRSDSHHKLGKNFWKHHGLNRESLISSYNTYYEAHLRGEAA